MITPLDVVVKVEACLSRCLVTGWPADPHAGMTSAAELFMGIGGVANVFGSEASKTAGETGDSLPAQPVEGVVCAIASRPLGSNAGVHAVFRASLRHPTAVHASLDVLAASCPGRIRID